jgi:hypothetical protein
MKTFGMLTDQGNALIQGIVFTAKSTNLGWDQVNEILWDVSTLDGFEEASDTIVREAVYMELQNG